MLTEGACILSGMGYNGFDAETGEAHWDRLENVDAWSLETAQNPHAYLGSWNKNTNHWLRNYMYLRVTPKGKKPGFRATLATFGTSAFWHGFYPGYYLTFILGSLIQTAAKNFRRHVRPFFLTAYEDPKPTPKKPIYDFLSWLATQLTLSFCVAPFIALRLDASLQIWSRLYFYGILNVIASAIFFSAGGKQLLKNQLSKRTVRKLKQREKEELVKEVGEADGGIPPQEQPILGLPEDMERDINEAVWEVTNEIKARQRRGSKVEMPSGKDLKALLEEKLGRKL
ncbi:lysophospholipid acyltransferase [Ascosphaera atra]|nr:lysophospholipid acyltransferase [Ascosphaera atra]